VIARQLLSIAPAPGPDGRLSLPDLAAACGSFTQTAARVASDLDGSARRGLLGLFAELAELPRRDLPALDAAARLQEAVRALSVDSSTPAPGHLHVARVASAAWCGRKHLFVPGLDESRFPGGFRQDPVLSDAERARINAALGGDRLPLRGRERPAESRRGLESALARFRGVAALSYSTRNLVEDADQFPSPFLLAVHRARVTDPKADYGSLRAALGTGVSFIPSAAPLDEPEWWLKRLDGVRGEAALLAVHRIFPWLQEGARAEAARRSSSFTGWDGLVEVDPSETDPRLSGRAVSASGLERLASCPYRYFLSDVLGLSGPDEERPSGEWLLAKEFGLLLHEVLQQFVASLEPSGTALSLSAHGPPLARIAEDVLQQWRVFVPPPSEAAFQARRAQLLDATTIFLKFEEEMGTLCGRWAEVGFGRAGDLAPGALGSPEAARIPLQDGSAFHLQGRIDRLDETVPGRWQVWDYKSGSSRTYREGQSLEGGRRLQAGLYARAARELLHARGRAVDDVRSGYVFPTATGGGARIVPSVRDEELETVLGRLFDLLKTGTFVHTPVKDDCRFCDFTTVCGNAKAAAHRAELKLSNARDSGDSRLRPFRELRGEDE